MLSTLLTGRLLKSETLVSNLLHVALVRDLSPFVVSLLTSAGNLLQAFIADALMARWIPNFGAVE